MTKPSIHVPGTAHLSRVQDSMALINEEALGSVQSNLASLAGQDFKSVETEVAAMDGFWPGEGSYMAYCRPYRVEDGILHIKVKGIPLNDFPYQFSFATGYEYIWEAILRGHSDPAVDGIALMIDSPGGVVNGVFDLVDRVTELRAESEGAKPLYAFAADNAYSAAYAVASLGDSINVTRTGGVGSIGVIWMHVDVSEALGQSGIKVTVMSAPEGGNKDDLSPYKPLSEEAYARCQVEMERVYSIFTSTVARNRGITEAQVRGTKALTYSADEAVSVGLADTVNATHQALTLYSEHISQDDEEPMSKTNSNSDSEASAQQLAVTKQEGFDEGVAAERGRTKAILGCSAAEKRPAAAMSALLNTTMSADEADTFLGSLPEERPAGTNADDQANNQSNNQGSGQQHDFSAVMRSNNPDVGPDDEGDGEGDEKSPSQLATDFGLAGFSASKN